MSISLLVVDILKYMMSKCNSLPSVSEQNGLLSFSGDLWRGVCIWGPYPPDVDSFTIHSRGNDQLMLSSRWSQLYHLHRIDVKMPLSEKHLQKLLKAPKNFSDELQMDCAIDKEKSIRIVKGWLL